MADEQANRGAQSVRRVLSILLCWTDRPTLTLTEVSKKTGLTLSTAHRMIRALVADGFLVPDPATGAYGIGPAIPELARVVFERGEQDELPLVATPHMERMRAITGETVGLHLPNAYNRICIAELVSRQPIRSATGVGQSFALPAGAAGKVLVAWSPERLKMVKAASKEPLHGLEAELKEIAAQGYAMSFGQTIAGASGLAFPIIAAGEAVIAAVNITGPRERWTRERMEAVLPDLRNEVDQINLQLGHRPVQD